MEPNEPAIIEVQCGSNDRPISFILHGEKLMVDEILDYWYSPEYQFFKILADDGNRYLLKYNFNGKWMLERAFPG